MKYFSILLVFILFYSCSKKDETRTNQGQDVTVKLLKKMTFVDILRPESYEETLFEYDSINKKILSVKKFNKSGQLLSQEKYTYQADTTKIKNYLNGKLESYSIEYPTSQAFIKRKDNYSKNTIKPNVSLDSIVFNGYSKITTDHCKRITRIEYYSWKDVNTYYEYKTYSYTDQNGSYTLSKFLNNGDLLVRLNVIKSDKVSSQNKVPDFQCYERNTSQVNASFKQTVFNYNATYDTQFDSDYYPVSKKRNITRGSSTTKQNYTYEYY